MHLPNQSALPAKKGSLSYSFNEKPYVHPKMVWELMPWISDTDQQMLSLSVSGCEGSNRYYEAIVKRHSMTAMNLFTTPAEWVSI